MCKCGEKKKKTLEHINTPVFLISTGRFEREIICASLKDAGIPYQEKNSEKNLGDELITGHDLTMSGYDILVPFSALPKACEALNSANIDVPFDDETLELVKKEINKMKKELKSAEEMSPAKRATVKIISAIVFLLLVAGVVFGSDALIQWIKSLF